MKYEFKGTPGEWTLGDENNHCFEVMIGVTPCSLQRNGLWDDTYMIERDEMIANGHLIMAAPDLLQAAINAMNIVELWGPDQHGTVGADHEGEMQALSSMKALLTSAIKKALNQQP